MALFRRKEAKPGKEAKSAAALEKNGPSPGPDVPDWVTDVDRVRPLLRVQLVRPDRMPAGPAPVSKPILGGDLVAVLEARDTMRVMPEHLAWWGMEPEELWTVALHNMRLSQPSVERNGGAYVMLGDAYTAANLVRLHEFAEMPEDGVLAWIPECGALLYTPITDAERMIQGINGFAKMRQGMEADWGGSAAAAEKFLLRDFIWLRGELAERVMVSYEADGPKHANVNVTGSPRFSEVWMRLAREFAETQRGS